MAEKLKITEGPWVLQHESLRGGRFWVVERHDRRDTIDLHEDDNGEADARAIASLPDLIEAAKPFERWLRDLDPEFSDHEDDIIVAGRGENVITFGHLRALRSVLTRIQGGE